MSRKPYKTITISVKIKHRIEDAYINIYRNHKTCNVQWSIGGIDNHRAESDAIRDYLAKSGMLDRLDKWRSENRHLIRNRGEYFLVCRWGHCNYITEDIADDLATIVKDYFEEAILNSLGITPKTTLQSLRETPSKTPDKIAA